MKARTQTNSPCGYLHFFFPLNDSALLFSWWKKGLIKETDDVTKTTSSGSMTRPVIVQRSYLSDFYWTFSQRKITQFFTQTCIRLLWSFSHISLLEQMSTCKSVFDQRPVYFNIASINSPHIRKKLLVKFRCTVMDILCPVLERAWEANDSK